MKVCPVKMNMTKKQAYILAIDHGTSGVKASLVSVQGKVTAFEFLPTEIHYLPGGGVEQNPEQWWFGVLGTTSALMRKKIVSPEEVVAVSVSSTFSSTVAVDRDGQPLMNAITWMDTRGAPYVKKTMAGFPAFRGYGLLNAWRWLRKTGGAPTLSGKDDIGHILFIQQEFPDIYDKTYLFLPSKDFLNLRLTGEFAATYDSMHLFWVSDIRDIHHISYADNLIRRFGIDREKLPPLISPTTMLGKIPDTVAYKLGINSGTPVVAGSPDHQTACIGSGAVRDYEGHIYIGTSSWVQCLVPFKKTDVFHSVASFPTAVPGRYQTVNEQDIAGGALAFLLDNLLEYRKLIAGSDLPDDPYRYLNQVAAQASPGSSGVIFTPWLNGERTPVDDETIRGCLFNLSQTTTQGQLIRSILEGVAYNTRWSLTYVERFVKRRLDPLNIIGGGAQSRLWCQIMADVLNRDIRRVRDPLQANGRGAAFIAAVALGYITFADIPGLIKYEGIFSPQPEHRQVYDLLYQQFLRLYRVHKNICKTINRQLPSS